MRRYHLVVMARFLPLFLLIATLAFLAAACDDSSGVLFTLNGERVTEEQLRTEFRAAVSEGRDVFDAGCRAVSLKDDVGVIEFATALVSGTIEGAEPEAVRFDRLIGILRSECRGLES